MRGLTSSCTCHGIDAQYGCCAVFTINTYHASAVSRYFRHGTSNKRAMYRRIYAMTPRCSASAAIASVDELSEDEKRRWRECTAELMAIGLDEEEAERSISKAFGWSGQAYWRSEKVNQVPEQDQIGAVLAFLCSLGIEDSSNQASMIKKFPELLGLDIKLMQSNVEKLRSAYFLKGKALSNSVQRKPRVLGSTVDCEGSCQGYCTRCFAQF